jgi:hypothetical protein
LWWAIRPCRRRKVGGPIEVQQLGGASDNQQLWFKSGDAKGWIEIPFRSEHEVTAEFWVKLTHSWDYGTYRALVDGKEAGTFDLWNANVTPTPHKLGTHTLAAGSRDSVCGKAERSKGFYFGFDTLTARVPVYARPASVDLRTLQKSQL